ncbi:MAG: HepT-like ribonuclease domain-containing protein [Verrucomicrobiota bacterium]
MSLRDARITLQQIQDASKHAQLICKETTLEKLRVDWKAKAALERFLEIIGEAVKRLPDEIKKSHPNIPWKNITGTRDHLIHGYDKVDVQILWNAVNKDIPELLKTVEFILNKL